MNIQYGLPYPAGALSNLAARTFTFRSIECKSMEGLLQSLKYPDVDTQRQMCQMVGYAAKRAGKAQDWYTKQTLYWDSVPMARSSEEYQQLLDEAYVQLFASNPAARIALESTGTEILTHSYGNSNITRTVLTEHEFCSRLMMIRDEYRARQLITFE